jgi:hypothetical protein
MKINRNLIVSRRLTQQPPIFVVTCLVLLAGCGGAPQADYSQLNLVDVVGTVQLEGKPVKGAVVAFQDIKTSTESYGLTDDDGRYRLHFDSVEYGVMPGEKIVMISTTRKVLGLNSDSEGGESEEENEEFQPDEPVTELIPADYRVNSGLRVTVSSSTTEFNFNLAADGSTTSAE